MRAHFIKMFNYDRFANDLIFKIIIEAGATQKPIQLFAHLLTASQAWLRRCKGSPSGMPNAWPDLTAAHCAQLIGEHHEAWLTYLEELPIDDFEKVIDYQNFSGNHLRDQLSDILAHVINHGTHTRAQIGQQLKFAGMQSLPITDYTYYLRVINGTI